ncbi:MAG: hypothetical protein PUI84_06700 [Bacteroidales bacterium]|nr:hypothetical protein [Porphyromonas sp.]MDD6934991.1 hypothetical protein [Bacteroidales bacterium]
MFTNKFFLSILLSVSAIVSALAQHTPVREYFCDPAKYHYRIKSYQSFGQIHTFEYDEKGYVTSLVVMEGETKLVSKDVFKYNDKGYLIERSVFGRPRLATGEFDIVSYKETYTRNEKGQMIDFTIWNLLGVDQDDDTLTPVIKGVVTYNAQGVEEKVDISTDMAGTGVWTKFCVCKATFDDKGRITELRRMDAEDEESVLLYEKFGYNGKGQISQIEYSNEASGGPMVRTYSFVYDNEGRVMRSGSEGFNFTYTYDEKKIKGEEVFFPVPPMAVGFWAELRNTFIFSLGYPAFHCTPSSYVPVKEESKEADSAEDEEEPKQDTDGMFVYESVKPLGNILIRDVENSLKSSISNGILTTELPGHLVGMPYYLCTVTGDLLQYGTTQVCNLSLDVANLPGGTYILKVGEQSIKILL